MESLSFDSMTDFYDQTRVCDKDCFGSALEFIEERFPPEIFSAVFEPGVGTGRIALPLAEKGYQVTGIDISEKMLLVLGKHISQSNRSLPISIQNADVTDAPFPDNHFDMAVITHLFYFIPQWRKAVDEILRVVKDNGPMILMYTGTGAEIPFLNARYKELCSEHGHLIKQLGVKSTDEVINYVKSVGCDVEAIKGRWKWEANIKLNKALAYIKSRAYSFTSAVPDDIHGAVIEKLESELKRKYGTLQTEIKVPNQIYLVVVKKL